MKLLLIALIHISIVALYSPECVGDVLLDHECFKG